MVKKKRKQREIDDSLSGYTPKPINWNDSKAVEQQINDIFSKWGKLIDLNPMNADMGSVDLKEVFGVDSFYRKPCIKAIKKFLPHFSEMIRETCTTIPGKVDAEKIFLDMCIRPDGNGYTYSAMTIFMGAAIKIYSILEKNKKLDKLNEILDKYNIEQDERIPIMCAYDSVLFNRLYHAISRRNIDCIGAVYSEDDYFMNRVTVKGKHKQNVPSKKCFNEIIKLIDEKRIEEAINHFDEHADGYMKGYLILIAPLIKTFCRNVKNYEAALKEEKTVKPPIPKDFKNMASNSFILPKKHSLPIKKSEIELSAASDLFLQIDELRSAYRIHRLLPKDFFKKYSAANLEGLKGDIGDAEEIMFAALILAEKEDDRIFCYFPFRDFILSAAENAFYSKQLFYSVGNYTGIDEEWFEEEEEDEDSEEDKEKLTKEEIAEELAKKKDLLYRSHIIGSELSLARAIFSDTYKESLARMKEEFQKADGAETVGLSVKEEDYFDYHDLAIGIKTDGDDAFKIPFSSYIYRLTGVILPSTFNRDFSEVNALDVVDIPEPLKPVISIVLDLITVIKYKDSFIQHLQKQFKEAMETEELYEEEEEADVPVEESPVTQSPEYIKLLKDFKNLKRSEHALQQRYKKESEEFMEYRRKAELEKDELSQLRETIFKMSNSDSVDEVESDIEFPYEVKSKILVLGGFPKWIQNMKTQLKGNIEFIPTEVLIAEEKIRNADYVFFQVNRISHSFYNRSKDIAVEAGVPVRYVSTPGVKLCSQEIAEFDMEVSN